MKTVFLGKRNIICCFYVRNKYRRKVLEKMHRILFLFLISIYLVGCSTNTNNPKSIKKVSSPPETLNIEDYFPLENSTYFYKGEGNEFAAYKEDFFEKSGDYLPSITENAGTRIFKVYQLTSDGIYLVYEQPEYYEEAPLEIEAVKSQFNPVPLLKTPLKFGGKFKDLSISEIHHKLNLPIGRLTDVIVTENKDEENNTVTKYYWATDYGLVKTEFTSTEEEDFIITSELESIN